MHYPTPRPALKSRNLPSLGRDPRYYRETALPKLVALWPFEIADTTPRARARLIAKLKGALRAERLRGLSGHWAYDLARHYQLLEAYKCEVAALAEISSGKTRGDFTIAKPARDATPSSSG